MGAKEKKVRERKGKRVRKGRKHSSLKINKYYEIKGLQLIRKRKYCPRCGPGVILSIHKGREYCGRCYYTVFEKGV